MSVNDMDRPVDPQMDPHAQSVDAVEQGRPIEAQYVRQGKRNMRIVWVLVISLALAALFTFGVWMLNARGLSGPGPQSAQPNPAAEGPANTLPAKQSVDQDPTAPARGSTPDAQTAGQGQTPTVPTSNP